METIEYPIIGKLTLSEEGHQFIQQYEVKRLLGYGSYGRVFFVTNKEKKSDYAMKIVQVEAELDTTELEVLKQLSQEPNCNPYISCLHDYFVDVTVLILVMELVDGYSLSALMDMKFKQYTEEEIYDIGFQLFSGLAYIHSKGVAHRDISDSNVMMTLKDNQIKIIDLGVSCFIADCTGLAGNTFFLPPEINPNNFNPEDRVEYMMADVWAAGLILWQLLFYSRGDVTFDQSIPATYNLRLPEGNPILASKNLQTKDISGQLQTYYQDLNLKLPKLYAMMTSSVAVLPNRLTAREILNKFG